MAVRVKVKRGKPTPVRFTADDFAHPDERRAKRTGVGLGVGAIAVILGLLALTGLRFPLMGAWAGWTLLALIYYTRGSNRSELRRLAGGRGASRAMPDSLAETAATQGRTLGVLAGVVLAGEAQELVTVGNTVVVPASLTERLNRAEMWALVAREMGRLKAGHIGLLSLCRRVEEERNMLLRGLAFPLRALVRALANWRWFAALTADRMAMVLTRNRRVVAAALLKQATAGVEGITTAEIDEYLRRQGGVIAQSADVTTHFKLGEVLREREGLLLRLRGIGQYAEAEEYKRACERLDAAYRKAQKTADRIPLPAGDDPPDQPQPPG